MTVDYRTTEPTLLHTLRALRGDPGRAFTYLDGRGGEERTTFAELAEQADAVARTLRSKGLARGDRVALVLPEARDFVPFFLGAVRLGVIPVPMAAPVSLDRLDAWQDSTGRILQTAGARAVFAKGDLARTIAGFMSPSRVDVHDVAAIELPREGDGDLPGVDTIAPDDVVFLQFTSGSTGTPRGVRVTHRSLAANAHAIMGECLRGTPRDVMISWLPLFHDMGLVGHLLCPLRYRIPVVYLGTISFVMHPAKWMETVSRYRGTITFAPNFAYTLALRRPKDVSHLDLSCLRILGCGAEPNHAPSLRAFLDYYRPAGLDPRAILPCYGMAEATLAMSFCALEAELRTDRIDEVAYRVRGVAVPATADAPALEHVSCGRVVPEHTITVIADDGTPLPERHVGEILFAGPSVTGGYFENSEETRRVFALGGIRTGDLGYLADGEIYVTGRKKDIVIINGRNYDPQEIEHRVERVAGIRHGTAIAFSRSGASTEELIVVAETRERDVADLAARVRREISETLGLTARDVHLVAFGCIPKTTSGKLQRSRARQMYAEKAFTPARAVQGDGIPQTEVNP